MPRFPLDASFQGVNRLFVLAFDNTENGANRIERDSHRKYFLPRVKGETGKGDDYTTGCLLDYQYFKDHN